MRRKIWERMVPVSKADRNFDIEFWQLQNPNRRFRIAFDMLGDYYRLKGKRINAHTLRLQRTVENLRQV